MAQWRGRMASFALAAIAALSLAARAAPVAAMAAVGSPTGPGARSAAGSIGAPTLRVYYTNPTLVRAGERVLMPVDAVCAAADGTACPASVTLWTRVAGEGWRSTTAQASPFLRFDLSGPALRSVRAAEGGAVEFFIRAQGLGGVTAALGGPEPGRSLRFLVVRSLRSVPLPALRFGAERTGRVRLFLPWGTGPMRAGLSPGNESATVGPSSFDVDRSGRVHLADPLQGRVAVFDGGRLATETRLELGANALVAVAPGGDRFVADRSDGTVRVRRVPASGMPDPGVAIDGVPSELRASRQGVYLRVLPLDAVRRADRPDPGDVLAGFPEDDVQIVRIGREHSVRLATLVAGSIRDAVELTSEGTLGEVALASSDGRGGYVVVVHVVGGDVHPADQFEVLRVVEGRIAGGSFAVASDSFTDLSPLARFRLGPDGHLYQLKTFPDGVRVVRFDLGEAP